MVKVISAHHFSCQDIQTCDEPVAATTAPNDFLLLALGNHLVEVRDLNQGAGVCFTFPTVDQVVSITHCTTGNYVATVEAKKNRQGGGKEPTFARIYTNWDADTGNQPMRARIAGRVTPSSSQSGANALEMIELPLKKPAVALACCQNSGNVLVACRKTLYVYQLCLKVHEMSKARFLDFEECLMLDVGFPPTQVAIFEDMFGCLSPDTVHVFKVLVQESTESKQAPTRKSEERRKDGTPPGHIEWNTNIKEVPHLACDVRDRLRPKLHPNSFPPLVNLPSIQEQNRKASGSTKSFSENFGPFAKSPVGVKLYGSASLGAHGKVLTAEACSLFHLQNPDGSKDDFQAMAFKPALWPKPDERETQRRRKASMVGFLHSSRYSKLSGTTWLIATRQEGFLYHVPTHVSPEEVPGRVFCLATYPFTANVFRVAMESYILHALTETGLETYTLRDAHFVAKDGDTGEAVPASKDPICLIGLRPFFGVEHLLVSESHLVLLACAEGSSSSSQESQEEGEVLPYWDLQDGSWTVYSLSLPTPSTLYQDMVGVARAHRPNSLATYAYLLAEAHLVARAGLQQRLWQWATGEKVHRDDLQRLKDMYRDSCALLADHYLQCEDQCEWRLAATYYRMSGLSVSEVITRVSALGGRSTQEPGNTNRAMTGLMVYLKSVMMDPRQDPLPTPLANAVIELFGEHAPQELADIVLGSNSLRECKVDRILQAMRKHLCSQPSRTAEESLSLSLLYMQKGSSSQSQSILSSLQHDDLTIVLRENHHLLVEIPPSGQVAFSDLASLVRDVRPDVLVDVMASLVQGGKVALSVVLLMFLDSLPMASGDSAAGCSGSALLRGFLETYFTRWSSCEKRDVEGVNPEHNQALQLLVRANLASLCSPPPTSGGHEHRDELFGKRPNYLDLLPPFLGEEDNNATQAEHEYHLAILYKLQSLLCAPFVTKDCLNTVVQFVEANPTVCGALSLRVLCCPPVEATALLLDEHPQVVSDYAKESVRSEEEWRALLQLLGGWVERRADDQQKIIGMRAQRVLLHHLAQTMSPASLSQSLPPASDGDFSPYVRQCRQVQQANQMRTLIMNTGQQLLESLNL